MALPTLLSMRELTVFRGRSSSSLTDAKAQRLWRLVFTEIVDQADMDSIRFYAGLPVHEDPYKEGDPRRLIEKSLATTGETGREFLVYADYETPTGESALSPLSRKDETSGDFATESKPYYVDTEDQIVFNAAAELFEQQPTRLAGVFKFTVSGNRAFGQPIDAWAAYLYPFCTFNNATTTIRGRVFGAKKLLMLGMSYTEQIENGFQFERWTWQLAVNPLGWDKQRVPNRGYSQLVGGVRQKIRIGNPPEPVSQPYPLNEDGTKKASMFAEPSNSEFFPYLGEDFSAFGWTTLA